MTWNWNHTPEAYDNVYYNISQLSLETLQVIAAEITTYQLLVQFENQVRLITGEEPLYDIDDREWFWDADLNDRILNSKFFSEDNVIEGTNIPNYYSKEQLTELIYKFASEQAECTNGGHEAYVCPYNCHLVSFSRE